MERNSKLNLSMLPGSINACSFNDTNATFQLLFNKSLENEKQLCNGYGVNNISETNNSLLKTLNLIDSNINEYPAVKSETYTLDDLLDLENEDLNQVPFYNETPAFDDDTLFVPSTEILMDTALASPLSSSSDESCDLDDLLFLCDQDAEIKEEQTAPVQEAVSIDHQYALVDAPQQQEPEMSLEDMLAGNGTDLSALCSLLFQSKGIEAPELSVLQEQPATVLEEQPTSAPLSPASSVTSSESDSETRPARYKPYKKKTTEQKLRKKAQNRTAATRYRIKKKDELKSMTEEADKLEETNKELKGKVDGLRNEIDYLKNLMLDVIKARLAKGATPDVLLSAAALMLE